MGNTVKSSWEIRSRSIQTLSVIEMQLINGLEIDGLCINLTRSLKFAGIPLGAPSPRGYDSVAQLISMKLTESQGDVVALTIHLQSNGRSPVDEILSFSAANQDVYIKGFVHDVYDVESWRLLIRKGEVIHSQAEELTWRWENTLLDGFGSAECEAVYAQDHEMVVKEKLNINSSACSDKSESVIVLNDWTIVSKSIATLIPIQSVIARCIEEERGGIKTVLNCSALLQAAGAGGEGTTNSLRPIVQTFVRMEITPFAYSVSNLSLKLDGVGGPATDTMLALSRRWPNVYFKAHIEDVSAHESWRLILHQGKFAHCQKLCETWLWEDGLLTDADLAGSLTTDRAATSTLADSQMLRRRLGVS